MKLIGMLDSPFVRRTAIGLHLLGVSFDHESISVMREFEKFQDRNPVVKAPTLVFDDGSLMIDSSLILEFFESQTDASLWAKDSEQRRAETQIVGLGLAACEKVVQNLYERDLRPEERRHEPFLERLRSQRNAAFGALEARIAQEPELFERTSHAAIVAAVALQFGHAELGSDVDPNDYPKLSTHQRRMEQHPAFMKFLPSLS